MRIIRDSHLVAYLIVFTALYIAGYHYATLFTDQGTEVAWVWLPAGVGFAALITGGVRMWPIIAVGNIIGSAASANDPPLFLAFTVVGNCIATIIGAWLALKISPNAPTAVQLRTAFALLVGGIVAAAISATIGVVGFCHTGFAPWAEFGVQWLRWFLGDIFGIIVSASALICAVNVIEFPEYLRRDPAYSRATEKVIWLVTLGFTGFIWFRLASITSNYALALNFLPLALLTWAAIRFDHFFNAIMVLLVSLSLITLTNAGLAGIAPPGTTLDTTILVLFFAVAAFLPMMISTAISHNRHYAIQSRRRALHDQLTGLPNRTAFEQQAKLAIDEFTHFQSRYFLVYLDLDNFKLINDTCGHRAGDEMLKQIAKKLADYIGPDDQLSRLGGDEFGLILKANNLSEALARTERMRRLLDDYRFVWNDSLFSCSASFGLAPIDESITDFTQVFIAADTACHAAKELGGHCIKVQSDQDKDLAQQQSDMEWSVKLNSALEKNQFVLYGQPIEPLTDDAEKGLHFEILIRLAGHGAQHILPSVFIPAAERFKAMPRIDRWVVKNSFAYLAGKKGFSEYISSCAINLSGNTLSDPDFIGFVRDQLKESKIPGKLIIFEITETAAIHNFSQALSFIEEMQRLGCRFALDDFGSGLSSFGYLKKLSIDYLKIDGAFVRDMHKNPVDLAFVRSINDIGKSMGKKTVAEYVESAEISLLLKEIGVDYQQGNFVCHPMPLDQLVEYYNDLDYTQVSA